MRQFQIRMVTAFGREELAKLFGTVGSSESQDEQLQKYTNLSALPMQKRKMVFRQVSSVDRSDLWRTHMALWLAKHPEMNEGQKAVMLDAMSLATPDVFEMRLADPVWKARIEPR